MLFPSFALGWLCSLSLFHCFTPNKEALHWYYEQHVRRPGEIWLSTFSLTALTPHKDAQLLVLTQKGGLCHIFIPSFSFLLFRHGFSFGFIKPEVIHIRSWFS